MSSYGYRGGGPEERGVRRKKLAAMAGSVYRAGVAAASELKEQYNNTRIRNVEAPDSQISIPGSFPNVAIVTKGEEQMVLFPSYAKRHLKEYKDNRSHGASAAQMGMSDEEYWRQEWVRNEDAKAIVDVDVRGWVYSPHKGPMTRRNRILIGLARRLSGIPSPTTQAEQPETPSFTSHHEEHERIREEQKIMKEAQEIVRRGESEKEVANRGGYSEAPRDDESIETASIYHARSRSGSITPSSAPTSPVLTGKASYGQAAVELTEAELAVANANLMARLGPFLTTPLVELPITIFFYNDEQSQSRTVMTNESGHFVVRAALDFVPTHVRVLANENLSATEEVNMIESRGVSLISDIDDTIKHSSISLGPREIFRNTFIRDLKDLTVDGVQEWYGQLHDMGVRVHYCSNSPWQLFPVIATYFHLAGLPPGSLHLKQYSGMLQGIFEPVAERKKGTLEKLMHDFPERKFLLVGDSGEADLEVYTELALAYPGKILAIFIRDVTTPQQMGYFDTNPGQGGGRSRNASVNSKFDELSARQEDSRPPLPPRVATEPARFQAPIMGTLIDFSDEPEAMDEQKQDVRQLSKEVSNLDLLGKKAPPPRPTKPAALRGPPPASKPDISGAGTASRPPLPQPRLRPSQHPLSQMQRLSEQSLGSSQSIPKAQGASAAPTRSAPASTGSSVTSQQSNGSRPPPPPPRRRNTPTLRNLSPRLLAHRRSSSNLDELGDLDALPGAAYGPGSPTTPPGATSPVHKKVYQWRQRLAHAHEVLDQQGVALYTWRRGQDVVHEAEGIVKAALEAVEKQR